MFLCWIRSNKTSISLSLREYLRLLLGMLQRKIGGRTVGARKSRQFCTHTSTCTTHLKQQSEHFYTNMWNSPFCLSKPVVQKTHQTKKETPTQRSHRREQRGGGTPEPSSILEVRGDGPDSSYPEPLRRNMSREPYKTLKFNWCVCRSWQQHHQQSQQESSPLGGHNHFNQAGSPTEGKQTKIQTNNDSSARNRAIENPPKTLSNIPVGGLNHQRPTRARVFGLKVS